MSDTQGPRIYNVAVSCTKEEREAIRTAARFRKRSAADLLREYRFEEVVRMGDAYLAAVEELAQDLAA